MYRQAHKQNHKEDEMRKILMQKRIFRICLQEKREKRALRLKVRRKLQIE